VAAHGGRLSHLARAGAGRGGVPGLPHPAATMTAPTLILIGEVDDQTPVNGRSAQN